MKLNRAGTGPQVSQPLLELIPVIQCIQPLPDTHDIKHSAIWNDSSSGLGGWGDQKNDHQVYSGGFIGQMRAYPSPHRIPRKFATFNTPGNSLLPILADFMPNTTMTLDNVALMVNGFNGNFVGFQAYHGGLNMSGASRGR